MSKLFRSTRIFTGDKGCELFSGGVVVTSEGKVGQVLRSEEEVASYRRGCEPQMIYDYGDKILMPGLVDSHVHVNEPGREEWEGFETATKAAAAGGFTTIVDMPLNSIPPTTTVENLFTKIKSTEGKIYVDVAFWGGVVPDNIRDIKSMVEAGVVGFKCFLCPTGVEEFSHVTEQQVKSALAELEGTGSVLAFHAELSSSENLKIAGDSKRFETFLESRPASMEVDAVKMISKLSQDHRNVRVHIVHLSATEALPEIRECLKQGCQLTVETCHHYLTLTSEKIPDCRTDFKCTPPIRNKKNQEKLWQALVDGEIQMVVSDHSPSTPDMKLLKNGPDCGDFVKAWGGIASNQLGLSLFWTNCIKYKLGVRDIYHLMCANPLKLCGFNKVKGKINIGFDADFCVWDPEEQFVVRPDIIHFKNKANPYNEVTLKGVVHATILRGIVIYDTTNKFRAPTGKILLKNFR